ncbi:AMP-dependent synthetase/ligase [Smaragdicoccus niigatensis]|uniref:AMP-dependent synthetase/ligase n=1 Tax=Smaragdicoccus niigatensis TaxID=359359 RepID=UPI000362F488|nr:AMP-dependent synthetase/ligase [Smaragdicoccus niigatensis]
MTDLFNTTRQLWTKISSKRGDAPTAPATMCEAFQQTRTVRPEQVAIRSSDGAVELTWADYARRVENATRGLHALGVRRGDPVALMLTNRPEFHIVDNAAIHLGAVPFSIYATLASEQIAHLFSNAKARVVVCEAQFLEKILAADAAGTVQHIVCVDADIDGVMTLAELEDLDSPGFDFERIWRAVEPADTLTIIYTSGTTGPPKGVELTHAGLLAEVDGMSELMPLGFDDSLISYLPDAHIANRWGVHYTNLCRGVQVTTLADPKQLVPTLLSVRPTYFGGVPQVWYKIKAGVEAAINAEPDETKRTAAKWAIEVGTKVAWLKSDRKPVPAELAAEHATAEALVLSKLRAKVGLDRVRFAASGAAALAPDATAFILALGLDVCELWGMSETSAVLLANPPGGVKIGTVGKPIPGKNEVTLAPDGELLVRGPLVMKGYRNDPEKTAEAVDPDGWLHTGDIATIDDEGYVRIVDRKKELIINSAGKNMSPSNIEGLVKVSCPFVGSVVAIGDAKPYVTALITLDPDITAMYAAKTGLTDTSAAALASNDGIAAAIAAGVEAANAKLARVEQIKKFTILPVFWEAGGEELTPTMKLKRNVVVKKYAAEVDALYAS